MIFGRESLRGTAPYLFSLLLPLFVYVGDCVSSKCTDKTSCWGVKDEASEACMTTRNEPINRHHFKPLLQSSLLYQLVVPVGPFVASGSAAASKI